MKAIFVLFIIMMWQGPLFAFEKDKEVQMMGSKERLTEEEGKLLLRIARETIRTRLFGGKVDMPHDLPQSLKEKKGTFVTLTIEGRLRGCIGHILPTEPLVEGVVENAINAAFRDPRFPPLSKEEFERIRIEVSVLTTPKKLAYKDYKDLLKALRPNMDGVIIRKGINQATFLPQVWEQLPSKEEFLTHLCIKAGLSPEEWKKGTLEVETYQVQAFHEEE